MRRLLTNTVLMAVFTAILLSSFGNLVFAEAWAGRIWDLFLNWKLLGNNIQSNSITSVKLQDNSVNTSKIASQAVNSLKVTPQIQLTINGTCLYGINAIAVDGTVICTVPSVSSLPPCVDTCASLWYITGTHTICWVSVNCWWSLACTPGSTKEIGVASCSPPSCATLYTCLIDGSGWDSGKDICGVCPPPPGCSSGQLKDNEWTCCAIKSIGCDGFCNSGKTNDCAGICGWSATDYNGITAGCGTPPPSCTAPKELCKWTCYDTTCSDWLKWDTWFCSCEPIICTDVACNPGETKNPITCACESSCTAWSLWYTDVSSCTATVDECSTSGQKNIVDNCTNTQTNTSCVYAPTQTTDCSGVCGWSVTDYNGITAGCGTPPPWACSGSTPCGTPGSCYATSGCDNICNSTKVDNGCGCGVVCGNWVLESSDYSWCQTYDDWQYHNYDNGMWCENIGGGICSPIWTQRTTCADCSGDSDYMNYVCK